MASSTTASSVNLTENETTSAVTDSTEEWMTATPPRIAFLAFFIIFGFVGNLFLIITICHSQKFRAISFNVFVINLAVVNLCECVFNMSILLSSSISNEWTFGDICCSLNAFFLNLVSVETILGLTILTVDRLIAVRYKDKYDHVISTPRITIFIFFTWFQSFSFSIPIAAGAIPTSVNNYTKCCTVSNDSSIIYGIFSALLCLTVPLIIMVVIFVKIIRTGYKERVLLRTLISQHSYKDDTQQEPRIKQEIRHSNLTGTTCAAWLIIHGPYVVTYYFSLLKTSSELETVANDDLQYVWYVDLVLLWLRFSYVMVLPIATFIWNKDMWNAFKNIILCRKNNSIVDESLKKGESDILKLEKKIKDEEKAKEALAQTPKEQRVFQVPVLFATSNGVHIQTFSQTNVFQNDGSEGQTGTLQGKKCDVIGSRENLNFEEDTSDYDSANELDPFSVSNPVSIRHVQSDGLTDRQRSISNPEVRDNPNTVDKITDETVGSTSAGDSGLDLSNGTTMHTGKTSIIVKKVGSEAKESEEDNLPRTKFDAFEKLEDTICKESENVETEMDTIVKQGNEILNETDSKTYDEVNLQGEVVNKQFTDESEKSVRPEADEYMEISTPIKQKKLKSGTTDSPAQRRKKKKRKEKNLDNISNASDLSSTTLPLRPPPRLAPIIAPGGIKTLQLARPGSSCSSQFSCVENNVDGVQSQTCAFNQERTHDCAMHDANSLDNLSVSSFSLSRHLNNTHSVLKQSGTFDNQLDTTEPENSDMKREIKCVPEEPQISFDTENFDIKTGTSKSGADHKHSGNGITNDTYERFSDNEVTPEHTQNKVRNIEARRKRRERLSATSLLNEGTGYRRLLSETP